NLNTKTAPVGGTWATSGVATDFATTGSGEVTRSQTLDNNSGRLAVLGSTTYTICAVQADFKVSATGAASSGLLARYVDASNYAASTPTADAAIFASQSLEVRHDQVIRQDSAGTIWTAVSSNPGHYLKIPPAGREGRTVQIIIKACRNDPKTGPDSAIDDISA